LDAEKLKKMAIDAGFSRAMAWYSVRLSSRLSFAFFRRACSSLPAESRHQSKQSIIHARCMQVVPIEAANTAEVMEKYTASPQVGSTPFPPRLFAPAN
jgi:hypothetical protein